jgi:hypothetical protein
MWLLYQHLGIETRLTMAYHPQSNGQMECANQEIKQYLQLFVSKCQNDWAKLLPMAEFILNSRIQSAYRQTLFEVLYGYRPDFILPVGKPTRIPILDQYIQLFYEEKGS